jgi:hypothetical protein
MVMARYMIATHRAPVERDWLCRHCNAFGVVTVDAIGNAEKRIWFSKTSAAEAAHDLAAEALQADADRVIALVRCPTCRHRPSGLFATLWHGVRDLAIAAFVGVVAAIIIFFLTKTQLLAIIVGALGFAAGIAFGTEVRRRKAAGAARVKLAPKPAPRPAVEPTRTPERGEADPFRAPPAPPPIAVITPPVATVAPRAHSESGEQPAFLR